MLTADMSLVRLLLERADELTRHALDQTIADTRLYPEVYAERCSPTRALSKLLNHEPERPMNTP